MSCLLEMGLVRSVADSNFLWTFVVVVFLETSLSAAETRPSQSTDSNPFSCYKVFSVLSTRSGCLPDLAPGRKQQSRVFMIWWEISLEHCCERYKPNLDWLLYTTQKHSMHLGKTEKVSKYNNFNAVWSAVVLIWHIVITANMSIPFSAVCVSVLETVNGLWSFITPPLFVWSLELNLNEGQ